MLYKVLLLIIAPISLAVAEPKAAQQLTHLLEPVHTFSAHFDQTITSPAGKSMSRASGILKIRRPGQFYWEVISPNAVKIVSDGRFLWTYDIDLEQIIKQKVKTAIIGSPAALLAGEWVNLDKEFDVKYMDKTQTSYILSPKDKESLFQEIKLSFKQKVLSDIDMKDKLGHHTRLTFTQTQVNTRLEPQIFIFNPPKGVDLIVND